MNTRIFENPISRSFGIHLLLLLLIFFYLMKAPAPFQSTAPIEVTVVDKTKEVATPEKKEDLSKTETKKDNDRTKQIVQRSEGEAALEAKKNSYLSDKTRTVEEEKSARNSGELEATKRTTVPFTPSGHPQTTTKEEAPPKDIKVSDLGVKIAPKVAQKPYEQEHNWANPELGETVRGGEYIQGMKEGEVSALNTKESIFFSYFDRVRRQLDQAWEPILRENIAHIFKVGRRLASNTDYETQVLITLNTRGEVKKVQILEESGTHDLDQAAVDALNKAGPYPNPPKGLVDATGLVQIKWNFILKT